MCKNEQLTISVCMGSSCFPRGNNRNLEILKEFTKKNNLEERVFLTGNLCEGNCGKGPNISIGDKTYHEVDPSSLKDILIHHFPECDYEF